MDGRQKPKAGELTVVCEGSFATIRLAAGPRNEFQTIIDGTDSLSTKRKIHLQRSFAEFCGNNDPRRRLSEEKFKKEGNFPDGEGGKVAIWAFKAWKWRLYGAMVEIEGKRCFVGVRVDADKKQQRANNSLLKAAAKDVASFQEYKHKDDGE
jgi:hypothetical protein